MKHSRNRGQKYLCAGGTAIWIALALGGNCFAELKQLRPGFNLFTPRQDVQIGREAVPQIERQMPVVRNPELDRYLNVLLSKLEQSRYARTLEPDGSRAAMFPFQIHAVYGKSINAFSLPGGPIFVNTAAIAAAENEAQLAGVVAHEMSHIVLRHPTNQASKRNLVALPALLASALTGSSLIGQLAQVGIMFTANSALLKFSRTDETEADYNGAQILAEAGYDPRELARFFEHLEAKSGQQGSLVQFLSDHPNPGNRAQAINEEMRELPYRKYATDETRQFSRIHELVRRLPAREAASERAQGIAPAVPEAAAGGSLRPYAGRSFSLEYPENWQVLGQSSGDAVTIAPREGVVVGGGGQTLIGYGIEVNYYGVEQRRVDLQGDTDALIARLQQSNEEMRTARAPRRIEVDAQHALLSTLYSRSPYRKEREVDVLVTVARPLGLFYVIFIAPESQFDSAQGIFEKVVRSIHFE